jgi:catechol 2,3-dioxygenase-like lactoylglutathione lyase family enzyme
LPVTSLDHLVITIRDAAATRRFYVEGLGMTWTTFEPGREALAFGRQKFNIHHAGREVEPKALVPAPGSVDVCLLIDEPLEAVTARLTALGFPPLLGPVPQTGAVAALTSIYFRDPDGNLVEIATPG